MLMAIRMKTVSQKEALALLDREDTLLLGSQFPIQHRDWQNVIVIFTNEDGTSDFRLVSIQEHHPDDPYTDLCLPSALDYGLYQKGVVSIRDITKLTEEDILGFHNVGRVALRELEDELEKMGLYLSE
jgi:DNA-directed RNA polymerase alpha subunit